MVTEEMRSYFGTYRGLSPTDESPIAMGEIEIIFNEAGLKIRYAMGHNINSDNVPLTQIRKLPQEAVRQEFTAGDGGSKAADQIDGFQVRDDGPILLFMKNPTDQPRLIVTNLGEMLEILGPTILFDNLQEFERVVQVLRSETGNEYPFPRLEYEGRCEP